jgi:hypothetical protein
MIVFAPDLASLGGRKWGRGGHGRVGRRLVGRISPGSRDRAGAQAKDPRGRGWHTPTFIGASQCETFCDSNVLVNAPQRILIATVDKCPH